MRFALLAAFLLINISACFSQNISGVVNVYRKVLWADSAKGAVKLSDVSGFGSYIGRKVMLMQMKGATIDETNAASFGTITNAGGAGFYEVGTICGFLSDTMILERKLNNLYNVAGQVQAIIFPDIAANATVTDTLRAAPWDDIAGTGGVLALDVPGTLYLNKPVSATGMGFRGGIYQLYNISCTFTTGVTGFFYASTATTNNNGAPKGEGIAAFIATKECGRGKQANGGGGGNNHNSGGGGGGNFGAGGQGGNRSGGACTSNTPGQGGVALSSQGYALSPASQNRIFMGGGGGSGHDNSTTGTPGGHGGGIVYITANRIEGSSAAPGDNKIMANGTKPYRFITVWNLPSNDAGSDGAGGGGAGGTIILRAGSYGGSSIAVEANGGSGSGTETFGQNQCSGPGGGGGGGVVWFSQASLPAGVTASAAGGASGTTSSTASCPNSANSAAAGSAGNTLFSFALAAPRDTSPVCRQLVPLYVQALLSGQQQGSTRRFTATLSTSSIQRCELQKAQGGSFATIAVQPGGQQQYYFTDANGTGMALYRIRVTGAGGSAAYSASLRMSAPVAGQPLSLSIHPSASGSHVAVQVHAARAGMGYISVVNAQGAVLHRQQQQLLAGYNVVPLALGVLPAGTLWLRVSSGGSSAQQPFVKLAY